MRINDWYVLELSLNITQFTTALLILVKNLGEIIENLDLTDLEKTNLNNQINKINKFIIKN